MAREGEVSRRAFLIGIAGLATASRTLRAVDLPVISKRVEKLYTVAGCRQPNDLQFTSEGWYGNGFRSSRFRLARRRASRERAEPRTL